MAEAVEPRQAVAAAIQNLAAARLARGFVPLALLFLAGVVDFVLGGAGASSTLALSAGAVVAAVAMLAQGLRVVQAAFGRPHRPWMSAARLGSLVPPVFAVYVLGWWGLREIAGFQGFGALAMGLAFTGLGTWVMRSWMKVVELERLAQVMVTDLGQRPEGS